MQDPSVADSVAGRSFPCRTGRVVAGTQVTGTRAALRCHACGATYALDALFAGCPRCAGPLFLDIPADLCHASYLSYTESATQPVAAAAVPGLEAAVSLGEGRTPMSEAPTLAMQMGVGHLWIKNETTNPTGSYKDRLNSVAVSMAAQSGFRQVGTSSTGNQGVSLAAYAGTAGLRADVFLPLSAPRHAAYEVERYGGHAWLMEWDDRGPALQALVEHHGWAYVGRNCPRPLANPFGLEGYKTIAYEIVHSLRSAAPDLVLMPTCGGDGIYGVWRGFKELHSAGVISQMPKMIGCHASAAASIARSWASRSSTVESVPLGESIAMSLVDRRSGEHALWALYESGGQPIGVHDDELLNALSRLGRLGIFAEPAGAASLAALPRLAVDPSTLAASTVVLVVTGSGARWPHSFDGLTGGIASSDPVTEAMAAAR